ncbi:MAG TPA: hypothetical protein EYP04_08745, partial [Anaerolineae bacterium]|nr:hypothetical protein [Anaerolineae bacterium]
MEMVKTMQVTNAHLKNLKMRGKQAVKARLLRLAVSLGLMAFIFHQLDMGQFLSLFRRVDLVDLLLALILVLGTVPLNAFKWQR